MPREEIGGLWSAAVTDTRTGQRVAACTHRHRDHGLALECAYRMARRRQRKEAEA
jgi:hypothetical protein